MTPAQILTLAHEERPDLFEKSARALSLAEQIDPDFASEIALDMEEVAGHAARRLGETGLAKTAVSGASGELLADVGKGLAVASMAALGGAVASDLYDAARRGLTKGVNWSRIMNFDPELKNADPEKRERMKNIFNALHRYAPEYTSDPTMGASLLKQVGNLPDASIGGAIRELISSHKQLRDSRTNFLPDMRVGMQAMSDVRQKKRDAAQDAFSVAREKREQEQHAKRMAAP